MENGPPEISVQVIIPARNEQDCIGRCLGSLVSQQGISFAIKVVDDGSEDETAEIARSFPGVEVIGAPPLRPGAIGKCNALIAGYTGVTAKWVLFTDADTYHLPGSLASAVGEAEENRSDLLSYSPEQEVDSWAELMLMPLVFAELAKTYPPQRVSNPNDPNAAANGQYILVRRSAYEAIGGHACVSDKILEDLELATLFKQKHYNVRFRHGAGVVRARMYRSFGAMVEGWTKNLALLFEHPVRLAIVRDLEFLMVLGAFANAAISTVFHNRGWAAAFLAIGLIIYARFLARTRRAHFPWKANLVCFFGLPIFAALLLRSYQDRYWRKRLNWKGRSYSVGSGKHS